MVPVVRGDARELIAYAWYGLGHRPLESLVVVALRGPRLRAGLVLRIDLAGPRRAVVGGTVPALLRVRPRAVVALIVSERPPSVISEWAGAVTEVMAGCGLPVVDVLHVSGANWCSLLGADPGPGAWRPLDLESTRTAAHLVLQGGVLAENEAGLAADVDPPGVPGPRTDPPDDAAGDRWEWFERWQAALSGTGHLPPRPAGALGDARLRDALLLSVVPGALGAAREVLDGASPDLGPWLAVRPQRDLLARARDVLAALARAAQGSDRAEVLAVMAWTAWWAGEGARARVLAERARPVRLAGLVEQLLAAQVPPPWVGKACLPGS